MQSTPFTAYRTWPEMVSNIADVDDSDPEGGLCARLIALFLPRTVGSKHDFFSSVGLSMIFVQPST